MNIKGFYILLGIFAYKALFIIHWILIVIAIFLFYIGRWEFGLPTIVIALFLAYISYRSAGGKRNPDIWKGKDLYERLKYAAYITNAQIGFHSFRDQGQLLDKLGKIGIRKKTNEKTRQFIRDKIVDNRQAFNILREDVIIQMVHNNKELFWDGFGKKTSAQLFYKAEVIFNLKSSIDYAFYGVLEGLEKRDSDKKNG